MKKTYEKPELRTIQIQSEQFIANSLTKIGGDGAYDPDNTADGDYGW